MGIRDMAEIDSEPQCLTNAERTAAVLGGGSIVIFSSWTPVSGLASRRVAPPVGQENA